MSTDTKSLTTPQPPPLITYGQLSLGLGLSNKMTLNNFINTENKTITEYINNLLTAEHKENLSEILEKNLYIYGESGSGKTHLLHGICNLANEKQLSSIYLDAKSITEKDIQNLEEIQYLEVICVDNIEHIAGKEQWEMAFFNLFNNAYMKGTSLIMASSHKPKKLNIKLPDLLSRLQWVLAFKINPLQDDDLLQALKNKCIHKGIIISEQILEFIIYRLSRNLSELSIAIEKLSGLAIANKRKVTIPFVKKILDI